MPQVIEEPWNGVEVVGALPDVTVPGFFGQTQRGIHRVRVTLDPRVVTPTAGVIPAAIQEQLLALADAAVALETAVTIGPNVRIEWALRGGTYPATATTNRRPRVADLTAFFGALDDLLGDHDATWGFSLLERPTVADTTASNADPAMPAEFNVSWGAGSDVPYRWLESLTQQVVDYLRTTKGFTKVIAVPLMFSEYNLLNIAEDHPSPWINDPAENIYYETWFYPTNTVNGVVTVPYSTYATALDGAISETLTPITDTFYPVSSGSASVIAPDALLAPAQDPLPTDPNTTPTLPPTAPTLTSVIVSDEYLRAVWTAPTYGGSNGITSYLVTASPVPDEEGVVPGGAVAISVRTSEATLATTLGPLLNDIEYSVFVVAVSGTTTSASSNAITATPLEGAAPVEPPDEDIFEPEPVRPRIKAPQPMIEAFPRQRNFRPQNWLKTQEEVQPGE